MSSPLILALYSALPVSVSVSLSVSLANLHYLFACIFLFPIIHSFLFTISPQIQWQLLSTLGYYVLLFLSIHLSIYLYLYYSPPPPSTHVSHLNRQNSHQITDQSFLSLYHIPPLTPLFSHLL